MRVSRFENREGSVFFAELAEDATARPLTEAPWLGGVPTGAEVDATKLRAACPVTPSKVICIGRNYAAHAKELGHDVPKEPLIFLKPPSALIGPGDAIVLPHESARVEHEAELGVVIGRRAKTVRLEDALSYVYGYTCVGDITARDLQKSDGQWSRAKGFDTFCPVGPWIETNVDPAALRVVCRVNGTTRQDGATTTMIFDVPTLIAYASKMMTLEPGDLLVTGTPEGVGPLIAGDTLEIEVRGARDGEPGVGVLALRVVSAA
jgi:2-keto-4-pentenoate hydratase/2-oxohepta-3-ene-1,7-dioic acid hydratase in catechol pathway